MRNISWYKSWPIIAVLLLGVVAIGGIALVNTQNRDNNRQIIPGIGGGPELTISDIVRNTNQYLGQNVTLRGEVDRVFGPRVFVLDQEGTITGDEILIISRSPIPPQADRDAANPFRDGDKVEVTGEVRRLNVAEVEQELGVGLSQQVEDEFTDRAVVLTTAIMLTTPGQSPPPTPTPTL